MAAGTVSLGSPAGQGGLCADTAYPLSPAANPFRLTAQRRLGQAAWEPAGVGRGGGATEVGAEDLAH